jgi:hypothetical protein
MFPVDAFRATLEKVVRIFQQYGIRFHLTVRKASDEDRKILEELAIQLGLAPLLAEVLREPDEIS